jgi:hypothetical protein
MRSLLLIGLLALAFTSCNRNQRQITKIDGKWNVISAEISGFGEVDPDIIYEFEYCKLSKEDFCDFSIHNFDTGNVTTGIYSIHEGGTGLTMTVSSGIGFEFAEYDIIKLSNKRLILVNNNAPTGQFERVELKAVQ